MRSTVWLALWAALLWGMIGPTGQALGQPQESPQEPYQAGSARNAGLGVVRQNIWSLVGVPLRNPGDQDAEVQFVLYFATRPDLQFGSRVWLPPRSQRDVWQPVFVPTAPSGDEKGLNIESMVLAVRGGRENRLSADSGLLRFDVRRPVTVMLSGESQDDPAILLRSMRLRRQLPPSTVFRPSHQMPPMAAALEAMDLLVIADPKPQFDPAQAAAIRQWVAEGGRLWIMLDQVPASVGALLLRDAWRLRVLEESGLTRVSVRKTGMTVDSTTTLAAVLDQGDLHPLVNGRRLDREALLALARTRADGQPLGRGERLRSLALRLEAGVTEAAVTVLNETAADSGMAVALTEREFEQPVRMVRVLAPEAEVLYEVGSWPAMLRFPVGRGEVYVSTLEARAWQVGADGVTPPMHEMSERLLQTKPGPPAQPEVFSPYITSLIGHQTIGRTPVLLLLGAFLLLLVLIGAGMQRLGRLEWMAPAGAALALVFASAFVMLGLMNRGTVPLTTSSAALAQVEPDLMISSLAGLTGAYSPTDRESDLSSRDGGIALPENPEAATLRMLWTDVDQWRWERHRLPSGGTATAVAFQGGADLPQRPEAWVTFDDQGAAGRFDLGALGRLRQVIVAAPHRYSGASLGGDGRLRLGEGDALLPGEFATAALQDPVQVLQQEVVRQVLSGPTFPTRVTLLGWSDQPPSTVTLALDAQTQRGGTLVATPLGMRPPPAGARILVPALFVEPVSQRPPGGGLFVEAYRRDTRRWMEELGEARTFAVRFHPPAAVQPMQVESAELTLDLRAPERTVEILAYREGKSEVVRRLQSPSGRTSLSIDDPGLLRQGEDGGIVITVRVGEALGGDGNLRTWRLDGMGLALQGTAGGGAIFP